MELKLLEAVIFVLNIVVCMALPQQHRKLMTKIDDPSPFILGEGIVRADLKIKPIIHSKKEQEQPDYTPHNELEEESGRSKNDPIGFENEGELVNEHKTSEKLSEHTNTNKRTTLRLPSGGSVNVANARPIYITIPISIGNTDGRPIYLSVGGREIPITPKTVNKESSTKPLSPTSQYNRLLKSESFQTNHLKQLKRKTTKRKNHRKNAPISTKIHSHQYEKETSEDFEIGNHSVNYRFYF